MSAARAGRIVTLGESMALIRAAEGGSFAHINELRLAVGGAEANVATGLARLGVPSAWLGRVGDDGLGRRVLRELRAEQVLVHAIVDDTAPTGLMLKERPVPAATVVHYYRSGSAGSRLHPEDVALLNVAEAALLHVTGITLAISDSAREAVRTAVAQARSAGVPVSFDVNHRSRLWHDDGYLGIYREIACEADIVFASADEAALLVPEADARMPHELASTIAALGPGSAVIKLGAAGAAALDTGVWQQRAAIAIEPVDTVGAGDAFVAGWLAEWYADRDPQTRLDTAVRAGAFACLQPGDWEGLPYRSDLESAAGSADPVVR